MRFRFVLALVLFAVVACGSRAEETLPPEEAVPAAPLGAEMVVANALRIAEAEEKALLVEFGASWCTWCTNFQQMVDSADAGVILKENYVIVNLVVHEEGEQQVLEHPGGEELMVDWDGEDSGLPYYVFLDWSGNKIGDSNAMPDGGNIGFPVADVEIERFMELIDRTAPRVTQAERAVVLGYLERSAAALQ